ncbi:hypothetical protein [Streptomyces boninensis]|uniref:hypothetical protein n=1 Tax=Streptomyces boninensis TaxID=2039455 RepID=UPI003B2141DE
MGTREYFQLGAFLWDVTRAHELARDHRVVWIDARPWFTWLNDIQLNEQQIGRADLSRPLLAVRLREVHGGTAIIDGWHRVARSQRDGVNELPLVLLDEDEEYEVRVFGGSKHPPQRGPSSGHPPPSSDDTQPYDPGLPDPRRAQSC